MADDALATQEALAAFLDEAGYGAWIQTDLCATEVMDWFLKLPVDQRMEAMGMVPTYETYENKPTWMEADA